MNIILLGAPGSGKGAQAEKLAKKLKLYYFQTGNLSRELAKKDPRIAKIVESGELIPQEEMTMHVISFLSERNKQMKDILFEGFPRFISQYEVLEKFLKTKGYGIDAVISLDITEEEAVRRIISRRLCTKCKEVYNLITNPPKGKRCDKCDGRLIQRKDDNAKSIKVRFEYYKDNTEKLIEYLNERNKLIRVDAQRSIDEIFKDILTKLKKKKLIS